MKAIDFKIEKKFKNTLARAGVIKTLNGEIQTPAFIPVGTKATIKAMTVEMVNSIGTQAILSNTYHLYLQPGDNIIKNAGGLHKFMNWQKPMFTDSGGFQVFSLGVAFNSKTGKILNKNTELLLKDRENDEDKPKIAQIDQNGVMFRSHIDGSAHYITPEKSIDIQNNLGANIIFAFDECTSPLESVHYQADALDRTHRWAKRSLHHHRNNFMKDVQGIFGIVQGGRSEKLRKESAEFINSLDFDGFGIGGSFEKEDMNMAIKWCNEILDENRPRHLLGIGEPMDIFEAVLNGCDTFDCVAPTRMARNGTLYTNDGRINILNSGFREDFNPVSKECSCYTCSNYTRSYLCHLFHSKEILASILASIHNLYFIVNLVSKIRETILDESFLNFKEDFIKRYYKI